MTFPRPRKLKLPTREPWERDLYLLWAAMALTMVGLGSVFPFLPLYMRELGVEGLGQAALWAGIAGGVSGFLMAFSGPLWGVIGDRSGRKRNVVRGIFGFAAVMLCASFVPNVYYLLGLWLVLGLLPGPALVAMPIVTSIAPRHRVQYAVGTLMSASFLGFTVGPLIGGRLIDLIGFRSVLLMTAGLLTVAGSMVILFVKESRRSSDGPQTPGPVAMFREILNVARSRAVAPVLIVLFMVQAGGSLMMPALPLFLGTLSSSDDVASTVGVAFAIMGVSGGLASVLIGRVGHRLGRMPLVAGAFLAIGLLYVSMLAIGNIASTYVVLGAVGFIGGALVTSTFALVGTSAGEDQGTAYGAAHSASSLAWAAAPLAGGAIAGIWGLREVFIVLSVGYLLAGALSIRLLAGRDREAALVVVPATELAEGATGAE